MTSADTDGERSEIASMQASLRAWALGAAARRGQGALRQLAPEQLVSRLSAAAISPLIESGSGTAGSQLVPSATAVLMKVRAESDGHDATPAQQVEAIARQFEVTLTGGGSSARDLRVELAALLKDIDAGGTVLRAAAQSNDDQVREDLIKAIEIIGSSFTEMSFLVADVSRAVSEIQSSLNQQLEDTRRILELNQRQVEEIRLVREALGGIEEQTSDGWQFPPAVPEPYVSRPTVAELLAFLSKPSSEAEARIAQLIGKPGIGKTYMALHAAQQLTALFPGGIYYSVRPAHSFSRRYPGRVLLIADDVEGMSAKDVLGFVPSGCDLLVVSRTPITGLPGRVFEAASLDPQDAQKFVAELLEGSGHVAVQPRRIAELAQGSPLMAYLLVEEAKQHPDDSDWLENVSATVPRFLELSYARLSELARALLRRLSLLRYDDVVDADTAAMLLGVDVSDARAPLEAVQVLFGGSRTRVDRAVRDFADQRLSKDESLDKIRQLQATIRRWRADRFGVLTRARITRDYWTTEDLLGYRPFADAIAAFIRHRDTRPPLTIGIKGPWGAGKTSLMRMVQVQLDPKDETGGQRRIELTQESRKRLKIPRRWSRWVRQPKPDDRLTVRELLGQTSQAPEPVPLRAQVTGYPQTGEWRPTAWFNPWMYQSGEQVWAGLAGEIIGQVTSRLAPGDRERFWLRLNLARLDREAVRLNIYRLLLGRLVPPLLGLALFVVVAIPVLALHLISASLLVLGGGSLFFVLASLVQITRFFQTPASAVFGLLFREPSARAIPKEMSDAVAGALRDPNYQEKVGFLHLVQTDVSHALDLVATPSRPLVLFVDDLDRCSPSTVTQVIEAISLFLAGQFPNCIFVIAMEPDLLAAHIEVAYKELVSVLRDAGNNATWSTLGWRFLDKIIQLPLNLPSIDDSKYVDTYLRDLLEMSRETSTDRTAYAPASYVQGPEPETSRKESQDHVTVDAGESDAVMGERTDLDLPNRMLNMALVAQIEQSIRLRKPSIDNLTDVATDVQAQILFPGQPLQDETIVAVDRVFANLYSDANAWTSIRSALPQLGSPNPREMKRYLNLFRFYTFITQRRRLEGIDPPSGEQIAKVAALAIRWPHLLTVLGLEQDGIKVLAILEEAATDDKAWESELRRAGISRGNYDDLKEFLSAGEPIAKISRLFV
jgi:hypothetical protein